MTNDNNSNIIGKLRIRAEGDFRVVNKAMIIKLRKIDRLLAGANRRYFYYTGKLCKYGHDSPKYVKSNTCMQCSTGINYREIVEFIIKVDHLNPIIFKLSKLTIADFPVNDIYGGPISGHTGWHLFRTHQKVALDLIEQLEIQRAKYRR